MNQFKVKTYSIKELASKYNVCTRTFIQWLQSIEKLSIDKHTKLLYPAQVELIISHLGIPE